MRLLGNELSMKWTGEPAEEGNSAKIIQAYCYTAEEVGSKKGKTRSSFLQLANCCIWFRV